MIHTAVLCAITAGIDDFEYYVIRKFNDTSDAVGIPVFVERED